MNEIKITKRIFRTKWISFAALIIFLFSFNISNAESVVVNSEAVELCNYVSNSKTNDLERSEYQIALDEGVVCADDLFANSFYAMFGLKEDSDGQINDSIFTTIMKAHGFVPSNAIKITAIANLPILSTVKNFIDEITIFFGLLSALIVFFKILFAKAASDKDVKMVTGVLFILISSVGPFLLFSLCLAVLGYSIVFVNKFSVTTTEDLTQNDNSGIISIKTINDIASKNSNHAMAMYLQATRTAQIKSLSFNKIFRDEQNKDFSSFLDHDIDLGGARDRVLTETPFTTGCYVNGEIYFELLSWTGGYREHIENCFLGKQDKERLYDYNYGWYGHKGIAGNLYVLNNTLEYDGLFAGSDEIDSQQSVIQEIAEAAMKDQTAFLSKDTQLPRIANSIRKYIDIKMKDSGKSTISLSELINDNPDIINYFKSQMQPYFNTAMTRAESKIQDPTNLGIFAFMTAGQLSSQVQGATFTEVTDQGTGFTTDVRPRFIDILDEFGKPFVEQINISSCSGELNYTKFVAPYISKVNLYNTLPDTTLQSERESLGIDFIGTNCVKIKPDGLETIGSYSSTVGEEAFRKAAVEKLALQLYLGAAHQAAVKMTSEYLSTNNKILKNNIRYGAAHNFMNATSLFSTDDVVRSGRQYLTDIVSFQSTEDFSKASYYMNQQVLVTSNANLKNDYKEIEHHFNKIDISSIAKAGTMLRPKVNGKYNQSESWVSDLSDVGFDNIIETLTFLSFEGFKQMSCLNPDKTFFEGIKEKRDNPNYYNENMKNYICVDIFTGIKKQGAEFLDVGVKIKIAHGVLSAINAGIKTSGDTVANLTNNKMAGKMVKGFPLTLILGATLTALVMYLDATTIYPTALVMSGIFLTYIIDLIIAIFVPSAVIMLFTKILNILISWPTESFKAAMNSSFLYESPVSLFTKVWKHTVTNLLDLFLYLLVGYFGYYSFILLINSISPDIFLSMMSSVVNLSSPSAVQMFEIYAVFSVGMTVIIIYTVTKAYKISVHELISNTQRVMGSTSSNEPMTLDKGTENLIVTKLGEEGVSGVAAGATTATTKILAMRKRMLEKSNSKPSLPSKSQDVTQNESNTNVDKKSESTTELEDDKKDK